VRFEANNGLSFESTANLLSSSTFDQDLKEEMEASSTGIPLKTNGAFKTYSNINFSSELTESKTRRSLLA
jgi:hypothetical protein